MHKPALLSQFQQYIDLKSRSQNLVIKNSYSNRNYTTSLFHSTEIVLSFPPSDLTILMQKAFICLSVKQYCLAETQEPIKLCGPVNKRYMFMTFEIHLPDLFKCLLNHSLKLVDVFASPLTGIQLSPDAKKLDKTRNLMVKHLSSKCCLMESEGIFF